MQQAHVLDESRFECTFQRRGFPYYLYHTLIKNNLQKIFSPIWDDDQTVFMVWDFVVFSLKNFNVSS